MYTKLKKYVIIAAIRRGDCMEKREMMINIENNIKSKYAMVEEEYLKSLKSKDLIERERKSSQYGIYSKAIDFLTNSHKSISVFSSEVPSQEMKKYLKSIEDEIQQESEKLDQLNIEYALSEKYAVIRDKTWRRIQFLMMTGSAIAGRVIAINMIHSTLSADDFCTGAVLGTGLYAIWYLPQRIKFKKKNKKLLKTQMPKNEKPEEKITLNQQRVKSIDIISESLIKQEVLKQRYLEKKKEEIENLFSEEILQEENLGFILDHLDLFSPHTETNISLSKSSATQETSGPHLVKTAMPKSTK